MPHLTSQFIKSITPPNKKYKIYYDDKISGFGIRIMESGVVSFVLRYIMNGRERRYTIGKYPDFSVTSARERALKMKVEISQNKVDPLEKKQNFLKNITLKEYSQHYLKTYAIKLKSKKSIECDNSILNNNIITKLGRFAMNAINISDVKSLHQSMSSTPYLANRALALLSKIYNIAIEEGVCTETPVKFIKRYPENSRERILTSQESKILLKAISDYDNKVVSNIILLLMFTGARKAEVLNIKWEQVDDNFVWTKPAHSTKQKKLHKVPLNDTCIRLLKALLNYRIGEYIFTNPATELPYKDIKRAWQLLCKKADIKNLRIHDLRHNFASYLINSGENLYTVGKLLGHTQPSTTSRYAHHQVHTLRDAVNKMVQV